MSFIKRLSTLTKGAVNDLLSKAVDMNSPLMVRQYVRDLEDALGKLNAEAATEDGQVRTATRLKADLDKKIAADRATISRLIEAANDPSANPQLAKNNQDLARSKASVTVQDQKQSSAYTQTITDTQASLDKLKATIANLENKHTLMVNQVRELERLDRDSKAKEQAARAVKSASTLISNGADMSIDDVTERMHARNDQANAAFDQAVGTIPQDENHSEDVDALLNSLTPVHQ